MVLGPGPGLLWSCVYLIVGPSQVCWGCPALLCLCMPVLGPSSWNYHLAISTLGPHLPGHNEKLGTALFFHSDPSNLSEILSPPLRDIHPSGHGLAEEREFKEPLFWI